MYTGNIITADISDYIESVYPCAYREHIGIIRKNYIAIGLSLCIQGTYAIVKWILSKKRFIPVHTGNISATKWNITDESVYPCAYREHARSFHCSRYTARFIPVHTGNMNNCYTLAVAAPVYPCAYREHQVIGRVIGSFFGLSLCIQGTFISHVSNRFNGRFIPVHTGNILSNVKL